MDFTHTFLFCVNLCYRTLMLMGQLRGLLKNMRTVWIAQLELASGESAWCR